MVAVSLKKSFFQAEDGIRDHCVTGVQACALPIWLYRIAYHHCMDILRKRKLLFFLPKQENDHHMSEEVKEALAKLSTMERALIFNRIIEERDYKELEVIYNLPAATLRKRYERARKKLSEQLIETLPNGSVMMNEI